MRRLWWPVISNHGSGYDELLSCWLAQPCLPRWRVPPAHISKIVLSSQLPFHQDPREMSGFGQTISVVFKRKCRNIWQERKSIWQSIQHYKANNRGRFGRRKESTVHHKLIDFSSVGEEMWSHIFSSYWLWQWKVFVSVCQPHRMVTGLQEVRIIQGWNAYSSVLFKSNLHRHYAHIL